MLDVEEIVTDYANQCRVDYVGLWQVALWVANKIGAHRKQDILNVVLAVVRGLVLKGVYPGDYARDGFHFWPGNSDDFTNRIAKEWMQLSSLPDLEFPICWFALR